jgi:glucokinase
MTQTLLAVDVGGTKCELALFPAGGRNYEPLARQRYRSSEYKRLEDIIAAFLRDTGAVPVYASIGVAGVVGDGMATVTNLPWVIREKSVAAEFGFKRICLINDLTAVCAAIALLQTDDLVEIQAGIRQPGQLIGVIAPGTGLGEGILVQTDSFFFPRGSEGGHADFAPVTNEQAELLSYMRKNHAPVSYEMLIAGPGIPYLYEFYRDQGAMGENPEIRRQLQEAVDRTPIIFEGAFAAAPCPLCRKVVDLFLAILGSEAGNLALKLYARGGLYIGGGIVPRLVGKVSFAGFLENFRRKAKMEQLMVTFPVHLIVKKDAALIGAARFGRETLVN